MNNTLKKVLTPLASLRITVFLIVMTVLLVFAGTTAQKDMGAWDVQREYFHTWGVMTPLKYFFPLTTWSEVAPGRVPMLGGYTIAIAMLVNVLAANVLRFRVGWKDLLIVPLLVAGLWGVGLLTYGQGYYVLTAALIVAALPLIGAVYWLHEKRGGVVLIHLGLILILLGELGTSTTAVEQQMSIDEGSSKNWAHDIRYGELAVIDPAAGEQGTNVVAIDDKRLKPGATVSDPKLPFDVKVDAYYPNSSLLEPGEAPPEGTPVVTAGFGLTRPAINRQKVPGVGVGEPDFPSAYVTLTRQGHEIGRYLVSALLENQTVTVDGKPYEIALRWRRYYKPYSIHLKDFSFDRHIGTDMARNYSSDVRLVDPANGVDRDVKIWMNHPLRYAGETFYQASFLPNEKTTVLTVVRNPSWLMPYIACVVGGLGMLAHFGLTLVGFLGKRAKSDAEARAAAAAARPVRGRKEQQYTLPPRRAWASAQTLVPAGVLAVCFLYLIGVLALRPTKSPEGFNLDAAASIPVNYEGRTMPMDSLARVSLKIITAGKEDLRKVEGKPANMQFLFDTFVRADRAQRYEMFRIDHPEVISMMGLTPLDAKGKERQLFAWAELEPGLGKLLEEARRADSVPPKDRTAYEHQVGETFKRVKAFDALAGLSGMFLIPPTQTGGEWREMGPAFEAARMSNAPDPGVEKFSQVLNRYHAKDSAGFDQAVKDYKAHVATVDPAGASKAGVEVFFNRVAPFYHLLGFYVLVFVLTIGSFLLAPGPLRRAAWWVLVLTILLHSGGLIFRMYLQGRPPVTTLYSSAIFIAWGGVLMAMLVERFFKNGLGLLVAAVAGFVSLFIAHNLAASDGDTLRELQAVLDTNFWLATHVVLITLGYAATFAAGLFAIVYVLRGVFTKSLDKAGARDLTRMVYGTICFAMLLSFVGTVLGGIWADQSWGRFWGWDPKENGAILIVLWNALILHSRWAGLVRERGTMVLAIFGSVVTAWSWFGTNELGVGLHAYGFKDGTRFWLAAFAVSQLVLMGLALLPMNAWRSSVAMERNTAPGGFPAGKAKADQPPVLPKKVLPAGAN